MGTPKLSHMLLDLGFFCALGTTEREAFERSIVKHGTAFTLDHNNGVTVIHDEAGRPWIARNDQLMVDERTETELGAKFREMRGRYPLKRGAYVPHSNDGGHFVRSVLPTL